MNEIILLAAAAQAFFAWGVSAEMGKEARAAALPRQEAEKLRPSAGQAKKIGELADKYDTPLAQVRSLRERGLGWGEVEHTLAAAKKLGKSPSDIADLREMGFGWWDITVKLSPLPGEPKEGPVFARNEVRDAVRQEPPRRKTAEARPARP